MNYQIILVLFGVNFVVYERVGEWVFGGCGEGGGGYHTSRVYNQPTTFIFLGVGEGRGRMILNITKRILHISLD